MNAHHTEPQRNMPGPQADKPLRMVPGVGEHTDSDGVLRAYVDPGATLHRAPTARQAIDRFMKARSDSLRTGRIDLREVDSAEGAATLRVRYQQFHNDIPVVGATVQAVADVKQAAVVQVDHTAEVDVSDAPDPGTAHPLDAVRKNALAPFQRDFASAEVIRDELAYLRDTSRPALPDTDYPTASIALLKKGRKPDGALHLVHDLLVETTGPFEHFRVVLDAVSGKLLWLALAGKFVTADLKVFLPDPVTESDDGTLHGHSSAAVLDAFRHDVQAEVAPADGGGFRLDGDWFRCTDWDPPAFPQPEETSPDFTYQTYPADRSFLSANAYYWLDSFARYLRSLGNATLNAHMVKVEVDAQAYDGQDQSEWHGTLTPPRIRFGEGGAPDAGDFGVIGHEYTHGVFDWLDAQHGGSSSYEHSVCDALPAIYRDRFNPDGHRRTETFPFDNNATDRWSTERRLDVSERFDDPAFDDFGVNLRNSMLGTALWRCYLGMGGDSPDPAVRIAAADAVNRTMLEMLLIVPDDSSSDAAHAVSMARGCVTADSTLTGGLYSKVMDEAFVGQGLWAPRPVDVYIGDNPADLGAVPSDAQSWTSPDIWVRNNDISTGDNPELGHEAPVNGRPNHLYVRVHNRGTQAAASGAFQVEAFRCDPGTGMIWPTHFQSLGTMVIDQPIPAGGAVRVGPLVWTPQIADHECLVAVVHGAPDPAVTATLNGPVPYSRLVRFDNNVGQRNVAPQLAAPGGKTHMTTTLHGGPARSSGSWHLDATALPDDTRLSIRTLSRLTKDAALTGLTVTEPGQVRSTLEMSGGGTAVVDGFTLEPGDRVAADITIDFSHHAEHLQVYPLVVTQYQDGQPAGRMTIQITAVKEREDIFFGNPHSGELHVSTCPHWSRLGAGSKVPFLRAEDALVRGYNGCASCLPALNTG
ncbi:predicted protein [Streptomyces viridochromogenes DSM 40736]|uniref:Predicted protein n=1 Tax=Streptomyces viridochromogenes (strain DSM 40736 / JCM 4977 / BCRC 1201 / Tue 494) TaxID=591159 RepID=D9X8R8_STRVT|nr:hypothetical protein [Streptomyces viridochromogenes]EFL36322.1 predicted protein [Streptomyces viridochromogenes DSM 40736]